MPDKGEKGGPLVLQFSNEARLARLDASGISHHVIILGIERRYVFKDGQDREDLLERLETLILKLRPAGPRAVLLGRGAKEETE